MIRAITGLMGAGMTLFVVPAMAAVPAGFGTAIDTYKADVTSGIGLLIAAGIVVYGAKKLGQKLGLL